MLCLYPALSGMTEQSFINQKNYLNDKLDIFVLQLKFSFFLQKEK